MTNPTKHNLLLSIALLLAVLMTACSSTPSTRVVLLPQENGRPSSGVVQATSGDGNVTVFKPYQRAHVVLDTRTAPQLDEVDAAQFRAENPLLFSLAPLKAERYTLYFVTGGTVLTTDSLQVMDRALADALARVGGDIVITGHTDTKGTPEKNDGLSQLRANEVRQLFIDKKFPPDRIESAGRGDRELAIHTPNNVDEPLNRRVVVEVR